jgi:heme-degrading monooxygenase HmoA
MHARVVFLHFDRSQLAEGLRAYREEVAPIAQQQAGFAGMLLLLERAIGAATSISLWDTAEALAATDLSPYYVEQISRLGQYFATAAEREDYEVGLLARGLSTSRPTFARVVRTTFHTNKTDEGVRVYDETLIANARKQPGFVGVWLLIDRTDGKAFSISLWDSEESVSGGEISPYYIGQIFKLLPFVASLPDSEQYEVAYHFDPGSAPG